MFEITFLGTSAAVPTLERNLSAIAVRREGEIYLLDCAEGTQRQMMRFGLSFMKVRAIFISHLHLDHFLGVFGLMETMRLNGRQEILSIYGPKGTRAVIGKGGNFVQVHEIDENFSCDFGEFAVSSFKTKHEGLSLGYCLEEKEKRRFYEDKAKKLGIKGPMFSEIAKKGSLKVGGRVVKLEEITYVQKGKKICYTGDTLPCENTVLAAKGADLLIHEATFGEDKKEEAEESWHSTARQAAQVAKKAKAKRLVLTHISGRYKSPLGLLEEARAVFKDTAVAEDGLKLEV
ncbi:MAG: ribonuclease Z [Candidatus Micrarchaeota archaeon]|nr:ribonuclease Z [Candidatus Micrarchaeota archaeon]